LKSIDWQSGKDFQCLGEQTYVLDGI